MAMATVVRTGQPARTDDYEQASPELAERIRKDGDPLERRHPDRR